MADAWALDSNRLVVIERDGGRGLDAVFRSVYVVDLRSAPAVSKRPVVDLAAIADPEPRLAPRALSRATSVWATRSG